LEKEGGGSLGNGERLAGRVTKELNELNPQFIWSLRETHPAIEGSPGCFLPDLGVFQGWFRGRVGPYETGNGLVLLDSR
jgi:hypothetical protein